MEKIIFTVTQINNQINSIIRNHFNTIYVKGEISSFKVYSSGHAYFTLKDKDSEIPCVFFNFFKNNSNQQVSDNSKVTLVADLAMYVNKGKLQLYVKEIHPSGEGELWLEYTKLKNKLEEEGLFNPLYKKNIPFISNKIGIITSSMGSVIRDIINIINRRSPYLDLVFADTIVQGRIASTEIIKSIRKLNSDLSIDLIIIARGGGSIEDLMCFNDENVVREVYASNIPIISAIGHETDFTLCDFVSDVRASTPSEAAEICSADINTLNITINELNQSIYLNVNNILESKKTKVNDYYYKTISRNPELLINSINNDIDLIINKLSFSILQKLNIYKNMISLNDKLIKNLNIESIKQRGFAVIKKNNKILKTINKINKDDIILIDLKDGSFKSKVISK